MVKKPEWRSEKYSAWLDQLAFKVGKPALSDSQGTQLFCLLTDRSGNPKKRFQRFLKAFRLLLKKQIPKEWLALVLQEFFLLPFHEFSKTTVQQVHGEEHPLPITIEDLNMQFISMWSAIRSAGAEQTISPIVREWRRFRARWNLLFDPFYEGNLPSHLYSLESEVRGEIKSVPLLRIGCPTIEKCSHLSAKINPEFAAFLGMYARKEKKHLYVNFQNRNPYWVHRWTGLNSEIARCSAVEGLHTQFPDTVYVITLAKDSPFYEQSGVFADMHAWVDFSKAFLKELLENSYNCVPYELSIPDIIDIMDEIHQKLFSGNNDLSWRERCDFIEIFYLRFIEYLIVYFEVDSYNASCTDCIDRGTISNVLMYFFQKMKNEPISLSDIAHHLATLTFAPALLVRQRAIRKHRLKRILSAIECLNRKHASWHPFAKGKIKGIA